MEGRGRGGGHNEKSKIEDKKTTRNGN
jgi:hypothetical protein